MYQDTLSSLRKRLSELPEDSNEGRYLRKALPYLELAVGYGEPQHASEVIHLESAPDGYRGSLTCLTILDKVETRLIQDKDGQGDEHEVRRPDGQLLGLLSVWYGNNGQGKLACEKFAAAPGVAVQWMGE